MWVLLLCNAMLVETVFGRQPVYGALLVAYVLSARNFSIRVCRRKDDLLENTQTRLGPNKLLQSEANSQDTFGLPHPWFAWASMAWATLHGFAMGVFCVATSQQRINSGDSQLLRLLSLWDPSIEPWRFVATTVGDAVVVVLCGAYVYAGHKQPPEEDDVASAELPQGLMHVASTTVGSFDLMLTMRSQTSVNPRESEAKRRFGTPHVLRWCFLCGCCALLTPRLSGVPLLAAHIVSLASFCIPRTSQWKWRLLCFVSQLSTVYTLTLFLFVCLWQSAAVDVYFSDVGLFDVSHVLSADSFWMAAEVWLMFACTLSSFSVHNHWGRMSRLEAARLVLHVISKQRKEMRRHRLRHSRVSVYSSAGQWICSVLPLVTIPPLIALSLSLSLTLSNVLLCMAFLAYLVPLHVYAAAVPMLLAIVGAFSLATYIGCVLHVGAVADAMLVSRHSFSDVSRYLWACHAVMALCVCSSVLFKRRLRFNSDAATKRFMYGAAVVKLRNELPQLQALFEKYAEVLDCSKSGDRCESTGACEINSSSNRGAFIMSTCMSPLLTELCGLEVTTEDAANAWECFAFNAELEKITAPLVQTQNRCTESASAQEPLDPSAQEEDMDPEGGQPHLAAIRAVAYGDFIRMVSDIRASQIGSAHVAWTVITLAWQLVCRQTYALALVAMFVAATLKSDELDIFRMLYIVVCVVFLCAPRLGDRYWNGLIAYTVVLIEGMFVFFLLYNDNDDEPTTIAGVSVATLGLNASHSQYDLWIYFLLLTFVVAERRLRARRRTSFSAVLQDISWRHVLHSRWVVQAQQNSVLVFATTLLVVVVIGESRSCLVAGFVFIFMLLGLGTVSSSRVVFAGWALGTAYSIVAFLVVSAYQFRDVRDWVLSQLNDASNCHNKASQCAAELGLHSASYGYGYSLTRLLTPWFLLCTSNVILYKLRFRDAHEQVQSTDIDSTRLIASVQLLNKCAKSAHEAVVRVGEYVHHHAFKASWGALFLAGVVRADVAHSAYLIMLVLDSRGTAPIVYSCACILATYAYPFYFVPELPVDRSTALFLGFDRTFDSSCLQLLWSSFLVFCTGILDQWTRSRSRSTPPKEEAVTHERSVGLEEATVPLLDVDRVASITAKPELADVELEEREPQEKTKGIESQEADTHSLSARQPSAFTEPRSPMQHFLGVAHFLANDFFCAFGVELTMLAAIVGIILCIERVTAVVLLLFLLAMWKLGQKQITTSHTICMRFAGAASMCLLCHFMLYIRVPASLDGDNAPFSRCTAWWRYVGCHIPVEDLVTYFLLICSFRLLDRHVDTTRARLACVEGESSFCEFLRKREKEIQTIRKTREDVRTIIPLPTNDIIHDPKTVVEFIIAAFVVAFPTPLLCFLYGILASSVVSMFLMLLGLCLLAFHKEIALRFYCHWPRVCIGIFGVAAVQLLVHLPDIREWCIENHAAAASLGVVPWTAQSARSVDEIVYALVLWTALLQDRVFSEFFFAAKVIEIHDSARRAAERHNNIVSFLHKEQQSAAAKAADLERSVQTKLTLLRMSRGKSLARAAPLSSQEATASCRVPLDASATTTSLEGATEEKKAQPAAPGVMQREVTEEPLKTGESLSEHSAFVEALLKAWRATKDFFVATLESAALYLSRHSYEGIPPPQDYSATRKVLWAVMHSALRRTSDICFVTFIVNFVQSGTVWDMLLSLSGVTYGLLLLPWPPRQYWNAALTYVVVGVFIKSSVKVLVEQVEVAGAWHTFLGIAVVDLGDTTVSDAGEAALLDIIWDFAVFAALLIHKKTCSDFGVYHGDEEIPQLFGGGGGTPQEEPPPQLRDENTEPTDDLPDVPDPDQNLSSPTSDSGSSVDDHPMDATVDDAESVMTRLYAKVVTSLKLLYGATKEQTLTIVGNVLARDGAGRDLYSLYLVIDAIALVYFVTTYYRLTGRATGSFVESVRSDLLPGQLVLLMFLMVLVMVVDRVVYVLDSMKGKCTFHITLCLAYHACFLTWRYWIASPDTSYGVYLFILKAAYLCASCAQIRCGFALHRQHDPFTHSDNTLPWLGHLIYRFIPFLFELRVLLDWTFTRTALKLNAWLTIEDIHEEVYLRWVDISDTAWNHPKKGMRYPIAKKLYQGLLGFSLVMVILFFPLIYYSTFNPNMEPNSVSSLNVELRFSSHSVFYKSAVSAENVRSNLTRYLELTRPTLRMHDVASKSAQLLSLHSCSAELWTVSSASRKDITTSVDAAIRNQTGFRIFLTAQMERQGATAGSSTTQVLRTEYAIPYSVLPQLRSVLNAASNATIYLQDFYTPFVFNKPNVMQFSTAVTGLAPNTDCKIDLRSSFDNLDQETVRYWCVECATLFSGGNSITNDATLFPENACVDKRNCDSFNYEAHPPNRTFAAPYFVIFSDDVPGGSSFLPNVGIIALYTTFILALGSVLRSSVQGDAHRVFLKQMSDPSPVAELVSYIYLSRSVGGDDDLALEEQLYLELMDMLRSPERLLRLTGERSEDYGKDGAFRYSKMCW